MSRAGAEAASAGRRETTARRHFEEPSAIYTAGVHLKTDSEKMFSQMDVA